MFEYSFIGYLNGFSWTGRSGDNLWPLLFSAAFVIAITYAAAFVVWRTKHPWLVAAVLAGVTHTAISIPYYLKYGSTVIAATIPVVEWFVVGSIAGLVTQLVPIDDPTKPADGSKYY